MAEQALFDFIVPDELLAGGRGQSKRPRRRRRRGAHARHRRGQAAPLIGILRASGFAPLVLLTVAAMVPGTFVNGIRLIGTNIENSFHLERRRARGGDLRRRRGPDRWGLPLALFADRGSRKIVAAITLLDLLGHVPLMALCPTSGRSSSSTCSPPSASGQRHRAQLLPGRRLSHPGPRPGLQLAQHERPVVPDRRDPARRLHRRPPHNWRWALVLAAGRRPRRARPLHHPRAGQGGQRVEPHPEGRGHGHRDRAGDAPRVLLGLGRDPAAADPVALLRAGGRGHPRLRRHRHPAVRQPLLRRGVAPRHGPAQRRVLDHRPVGLPRAARRLLRRGPALPARPADARSSWPASASPPTAASTASRCTCPTCGWWWSSSSWPTRRWRPLSICIFQTLAATAPPEMRAICFGIFGVYALVFGGFAGGDPAGRHQRRRPACTTGPHPHRPGLRRGRPAAARRLALRAPRHHPRHRGRPRALRRGQAAPGGRAVPALQIHNLDFYYGTQQVLFDVNLEVRRGRDRGPARHQRRRQEHAAAGRRPASTIPTAGVIRIFGANCTYLEPEQIIDQGAALLVGGKMTFPGLTVRENLRVGGHSFRRDDPGPGRPSTTPSACSPSSSPASTSPPAPCRAASSRCWPWPGS